MDPVPGPLFGGVVVSIPSLMGRLLGCCGGPRGTPGTPVVSIPSLMGRLLGSEAQETPVLVVGTVSIPSLMGRLLGWPPPAQGGLLL